MSSKGNTGDHCALVSSCCHNQSRPTQRLQRTPVYYHMLWRLGVPRGPLRLHPGGVGPGHPEASGGPSQLPEAPRPWLTAPPPRHSQQRGLVHVSDSEPPASLLRGPCEDTGPPEIQSRPSQGPRLHPTCKVPFIPCKTTRSEVLGMWGRTSLGRGHYSARHVCGGGTVLYHHRGVHTQIYART